MNRAALAWALSGAVRYAIATAIVSILLTLLLPDVSAERFATTAYLAVIFAAIVIAIKWAVFGGVADGLVRPSETTFPGVLGFLVGIVILLMAGAAFVSDPGAEAKLIGYCLAAVALAAIGRAHAFEWVAAKLSAGGPVAATMRYAAIVAAGALLMTALLPGVWGEVVTTVAYSATVVVAATLAWRLAAPAPVGELIKQTWADVSRTALEITSEAFVTRLVTASVVVLAAAIVMASLLRRPYSEPFATVAYTAAIFAAAGVAIECARRRVQPAEPAKDAESYVWSSSHAPAAAFADIVASLTYANVIRYAVFATVAVFVFAAPLWRRFGEPFAVIGYAGMVVIAVALAAQCRQTLRKRSVKTE